MKFSQVIRILALFFFVPIIAQSNERHFSYTYDSGVLPKGARELEIWNTYRTDRDYYYRRLDQRVEYEFGLGGNLMSALYLNYSFRMADSNGELPGGSLTSSQKASISSEWKYKLMDPVADPIGLALYGEVSLGLDETEIEAKIILDKKIGNFLFAFNGVYEREWKYGLKNGETEIEIETLPQIYFGATYKFNSHIALGFEVKNHNEILEGEWEHSALFLGPVVSYSTDTWWATFSLLPQIANLKGEEKLVLDEHEKVEARLLFSFHL